MERENHTSRGDFLPPEGPGDRVPSVPEGVVWDAWESEFQPEFTEVGTLVRLGKIGVKNIVGFFKKGRNRVNGNHTGEDEEEDEECSPCRQEFSPPAGLRGRF